MPFTTIQPMTLHSVGKLSPCPDGFKVDTDDKKATRHRWLIVVVISSQVLSPCKFEAFVYNAYGYFKFGNPDASEISHRLVKNNFKATSFNKHPKNRSELIWVESWGFDVGGPIQNLRS